jgi:LppP/LprE lipoprotein
LIRAIAATALVAALVALPTASAGSGDRAAAVALVKKKGYIPELKTWDGTFKLNVLIGRFAQSADGYNQRAFFFLGRRYLGTDAAAPSAALQEVWRDDRTIALLYILYRANDPNCCPTGGGKIVRFHWNGTRLVAVDRIPPRTGALHR